MTPVLRRYRHGSVTATPESRIFFLFWKMYNPATPEGWGGSKRRCVGVSSRPVIASLLPSSSPSHSRRLHAAASAGGGNGAWVAFRSGEELHGWKKIEAQLARGQERLCQDH
jgi:hypothetical protein